MQTFTTKVAAEVVGVHQQTVIRWAKEGFFKPSVPRRKWEPRQYTERDLAALWVVRAAIGVGIQPSDVAEMARMAQKGDEKQQKNAAVICIKGEGPWYGFVLQTWISNVKEKEAAAMIKAQRATVGEIFQQTSLYDIVQLSLRMVRSNYMSLTTPADENDDL